MQKEARKEIEQLKKELDEAKKIIEKRKNLEEIKLPLQEEDKKVEQSLKLDKSLSVQAQTQEISNTQDAIPRPQSPKECIFCKILHNVDHMYKVLVYGKCDLNQKLQIRITMSCIDDPNIKIKDEFLDDENIKQILTATSENDVAPYNVQAKGLQTLEEIIIYAQPITPPTEKAACPAHLSPPTTS